MRLFPKRIHKRREYCRAHRSRQNRDWPQFPASSTDEQEVESLMTLAHGLPRVTPLQVDAQFAERLEKQLLTSAARQQLLQATKKERWVQRYRSPIKLTMMYTRAAILSICLLLVILVAGVLALRSHSLSPPTAHSTVKQVDMTDQAARTQLQLLAGFANPAHAQSYRGALVELNEQITECSQEVATVPAGFSRDQAEQEMVRLKADTRHALYQFLVGLAVPERVLTTTELGNVGATVPVVQNAQFTLTPSKSQAVVLLHGSGIEPGAHLLIDNQEVSVNGTMQNGGYGITIPWSAQLPVPQQLGVLNTDHTAAQTTTLTITVEQNNDDRGGDGGGHGGKGRDGGQDG